MKISLALGPHQNLSRQTAWGCLTTNLFTPGFGSLAAGRVSGYPQAALGIIALVVTSLFGVRFIVWWIANRDRLYDPVADPLLSWVDIWLAVRWALAGILLFAVAWLWALGTSLAIVNAAKKAEQANTPPQLR